MQTIGEMKHEQSEKIRVVIDSNYRASPCGSSRLQKRLSPVWSCSVNTVAVRSTSTVPSRPVRTVLPVLPLGCSCGSWSLPNWSAGHWRRCEEILDLSVGVLLSTVQQIRMGWRKPCGYMTAR